MCSSLKFQFNSLGALSLKIVGVLLYGIMVETDEVIIGMSYGGWWPTMTRLKADPFLFRLLDMTVSVTVGMSLV